MLARYGEDGKVTQGLRLAELFPSKHSRGESDADDENQGQGGQVAGVREPTVAHPNPLHQIDSVGEWDEPGDGLERRRQRLH